MGRGHLDILDELRSTRRAIALPQLNAGWSITGSEIGDSVEVQNKFRKAESAGRGVLYTVRTAAGPIAPPQSIPGLVGAIKEQDASDIGHRESGSDGDIVG